MKLLSKTSTSLKAGRKRNVGKRGFFKGFLMFLPYIMLVLVAFCLYFWAPQFIRINVVDCQSQYGPCNALVLGQIKEAENLNLRASKATLSRLLSGNPGVKDYSVQFVFPDKIKLDILEKKISFALASEDASSYVLIDTEGSAVSLSPSSNLPYLRVQGGLPKVGEKVDSETLFALRILSGLSFYYQTDKAEISNKSLFISIHEGPELIFPLSGDEQVLLGAANLLLTQLKSDKGNSKIESGGVKTVDLRFKNPVLK